MGDNMDTKKSTVKPKYFQKTSTSVDGKSLVRFRCGETVLCQPPYLEGKMDYVWINVENVDQYNKKQSEKAIGIKLLPL